MTLGGIPVHFSKYAPDGLVNIPGIGVVCRDKAELVKAFRAGKRDVICVWYEPSKGRPLSATLQIEMILVRLKWLIKLSDACLQAGE